MERPDPSEYAALPPWDDPSDVVTGSRANSEARRHMRQSQRAPRGARAVEDAGTDSLREQSADFARQRGYPAKGVTAPAPAPSPAPKLSGPVHGLGGLLVGAVLAANLLAFLEYGRPGVSSWWSSKFWNTPTIGTPAPSATSGTVQATTTPSAGGRG
jgi:hypothetical protein